MWSRRLRLLALQPVVATACAFLTLLRCNYAMRYTIEKVVTGDGEIIRYYGNARTRWATILQECRGVPSTILARQLTSEQPWFEHHCGGRRIGQEIMVVCGITQFYNTSHGFDHDLSRALWVYRAFMKSYCSVEVKAIARDVASTYGLEDEDDSSL
jgi:hypothetical protein